MLQTNFDDYQQALRDIVAYTDLGPLSSSGLRHAVPITILAAVPLFYREPDQAGVTISVHIWRIKESVFR